VSPHAARAADFRNRACCSAGPLLPSGQPGRLAGWPRPHGQVRARAQVHPYRQGRCAAALLRAALSTPRRDPVLRCQAPHRFELNGPFGPAHRLQRRGCCLLPRDATKHLLAKQMTPRGRQQVPDGASAPTPPGNAEPRTRTAQQCRRAARAARALRMPRPAQGRVRLAALPPAAWRRPARASCPESPASLIWRNPPSWDRDR